MVYTSHKDGDDLGWVYDIGVILGLPRYSIDRFPQMTAWENTRNHQLDPAAQTFADALAHLAR